MPWPKVYSILYQAELRCNQGSIKQALLDVYRLHPFLHEIADTNALAWYYALLGNIHYNGGELDSAKDNSTKGLQLYTYINDTIHMMVANRRLGEIAYSQGDYFQAISRSYHGLSLNVNMDLKPFSNINPCGFEGLAVTQMTDLNAAITVEQAGRVLAAILSHNMQSQHKAKH